MEILSNAVDLPYPHSPITTMANGECVDLSKDSSSMVSELFEIASGSAYAFTSSTSYSALYSPFVLVSWVIEVFGSSIFCDYSLASSSTISQTIGSSKLASWIW